MASRVPKPSKPSKTPSAAGVEVIDLTSDTEASPPQAGAAAFSLGNGGAETSFPSAFNIPEIHTQALYHMNPPIPSKEKKTKKTKNNSKGMRRAADASAKAQQSEVISTVQPSMDERMSSRPAKRRKGPSSSQHGETDQGLKVTGTTGVPRLPHKRFAFGEEDADLELVGITGTLKLPHIRFACPEHKFEGPEWSSSHKEKCSLCYCYVCDRPAGECLEWTNHCHASDSGPAKSMWKSMRVQAQPSLKAGRRPPVSCRFSADSVGWLERLNRPSPAGLSQQAAVAPRTAAEAVAAAEEAAMQLVRNTVHPRPKIRGGRWTR